jgi:hypothetical protein
MRKKRKWIFDIKTGYGIIVHMKYESESVAASGQIKEDIKKWIFDIKTGNGMIVYMEEESESVAACAQIKEDIRQMKTT